MTEFLLLSNLNLNSHIEMQLLFFPIIVDLQIFYVLLTNIKII
jgi:hypothetical protein